MSSLPSVYVRLNVCLGHNRARYSHKGVHVCSQDQDEGRVGRWVFTDPLVLVK